VAAAFGGLYSATSGYPADTETRSANQCQWAAE
jgi:hypothetical protein